MKFRVCSKGEAELWNPLGVPHIIISISTPRGEPSKPKANEFTRGVLRLAFDDLDKEPGQSFRMNYGEPVLFDAELAAQIWKFVQERASSIQYIIVHCDAGLSRSPAVAAALAYAINGSDHEFWGGAVMYGDLRYTPNRLVYRTLLNTILDEGTRAGKP